VPWLLQQAETNGAPQLQRAALTVEVERVGEALDELQLHDKARAVVTAGGCARVDGGSSACAVGRGWRFVVGVIVL